jgi:putative ABC transport system permease protein
MEKTNPPMGKRFFRFLLRLLPADFRGDFGPEMESVFEDQRRETEGKTGVLRLWWETATGILRTAPREHASMLKQDAGYALRMMRRNLGFTMLAVLTLALGIGANTAIFTVVRGVLLRSLPYEGGEQLVLIHQKAPQVGVDDFPFSVREIEDYRGQNHTLSGVVEYHAMWFNFLGGAEPERLQTGVVSANLFDVMGVKAYLGRTFLPGEDQPGAAPVLVLSYGYWQRSLGGDLHVIGRTFEMNDRVHTVVGVLPPIPQYPDDNSVYMPVSSCPFRSRPRFIADRDARMMRVFARRKPGVKLEQVQADLATISSHLQAEYPNSYPKSNGYLATATSLENDLTRQARPTLLILLGTAGFVLLIACTNVANLTLARLARREREMAIRSTLGASRVRLVRQVLTEGMLLALAGGSLGLLLASWGMDLLVSFAARLTPRADEIHIDTAVLVFTLVASLGTSLLFGLLASIPFGGDLTAALKEAGGHSTAGAGRHRTRNALVVAQVALSFALLIGAGLMTRSLMKLQNVDAGFHPDHVLTMLLSLNFTKYDTGPKQIAFHRPLLERVKALPGVRSVAVSMTFPLNREMGPMRGGFLMEGRTIPPGTPQPLADYRTVSSAYFETIGMPLLRGRSFTDADTAEAPAVVIINQSMAHHNWGNDDPVGRRISYDDGKTWATIVGVVGDVRQYGLATQPTDELYLPLFQSPLNEATLLLRTAGDPAALAPQVISMIHQVDPQQPVARVQTMERVRNDSLSSSRLTAILLSLFAVLALVITTSGISGVVALTVSQRTHELGIRMALGATPGSVLRMVLRQAMVPVLVGLSLGMAGALLLSRLMSSLLYGIEPADPLTFLGAGVMSLVIAAMACLWPARRATAIPPMVALRSE